MSSKKLLYGSKIVCNYSVLFRALADAFASYRSSSRQASAAEREARQAAERTETASSGRREALEQDDARREAEVTDGGGRAAARDGG